jgi:hypothetical protein
MGVGGLYVCSYLVFPQLYSNEMKPVAPLIGIAFGLLFAGCPALAGIGFGMGIDMARKKYSFGTIPLEKSIDLIAFTQYLFVALALLFLHFVVLR